MLNIMAESEKKLSFGLYQLKSKGKFEDYQEFCKTNKLNWTTIDAQNEYVHNYITGEKNKTLSKDFSISAGDSKNLDELTESFMKNFCGHDKGDGSLDTRIKYAKNALELYEEHKDGASDLTSSETFTNDGASSTTTTTGSKASNNTNPTTTKQKTNSVQVKPLNFPLFLIPSEFDKLFETMLHDIFKINNQKCYLNVDVHIKVLRRTSEVKQFIKTFKPEFIVYWPNRENFNQNVYSEIVKNAEGSKVYYDATYIKTTTKTDGLGRKHYYITPVTTNNLSRKRGFFRLLDNNSYNLANQFMKFKSSASESGVITKRKHLAKFLFYRNLSTVTYHNFSSLLKNKEILRYCFFDKLNGGYVVV